MAQCRTERPETTLLFADPAAPPYHLPCAGRGAVRTGGGARGSRRQGGGAGGGGAAGEAQVEPRRGGAAWAAALRGGQGAQTVTAIEWRVEPWPE